MGVSDLPPPSKEALRSGIRLERRGAAYFRRLRNFAFARLAVFAATGSLVLLGLRYNRWDQIFGYSGRLVLAIVAVAVVSAATQLWASRRRRPADNIALSLLFLDQLLFSGIIYLTGGVASGATSLLGVTCVVGAVLLGTSGAIASVASGVIFFSLILLIVQGGQDLLPPDQNPAVYDLGPSQTVFYFVITVLMLILVGLLSGYLAERLARAGGEVVVATARAERAERMALLGRLAAGLAHEIRNPLSAISGSVQMLRAGAVKEDDRQLCEIVIRESARLDELVSDMLQLSRSGQKNVEIFDLSAVVSDVVHLAQRSGRALSDVSIALTTEGEAWVRADAAQIKQLTWNLIRNAVQASEAGGQVLVRVETSTTVRLSVEDSGVGLDEEAKAHLFEEFYTTRSHGTGLGLAVVKRIADEHDILLEVESDRDKGAVFVADFGASAK